MCFRFLPPQAAEVALVATAAVAVRVVNRVKAVNLVSRVNLVKEVTAAKEVKAKRRKRVITKVRTSLTILPEKTAVNNVIITLDSNNLSSYILNCINFLEKLNQKGLVVSEMC